MIDKFPRPISEPENAQTRPTLTGSRQNAIKHATPLPNTKTEDDERLAHTGTQTRSEIYEQVDRVLCYLIEEDRQVMWGNLNCASDGAWSLVGTQLNAQQSNLRRKRNIIDRNPRPVQRQKLNT